MISGTIGSFTASCYLLPSQSASCTSSDGWHDLHPSPRLVAGSLRPRVVKNKHFNGVQWSISKDVYFQNMGKPWKTTQTPHHQHQWSEVDIHFHGLPSAYCLHLYTVYCTKRHRTVHQLVESENWISASETRSLKKRTVWWGIRLEAILM